MIQISKYCAGCGLKLSGLSPRYSMHPECKARLMKARQQEYHKFQQEVSLATAERTYVVWKTEDDELLQELNDQGLKTSEIAVITKRTHAAISNRRRTLGLKSVYRGGRRADQGNPAANQAQIDEGVYT